MNKYKHYDMIRKPIITEKTTILGEQGKYVFEVSDVANKGTIKSAIESIFEVKVKKINIVNIQGKNKRFKGINGRQADTRKAIVSLEKDYTIDFTGGIK